MHIGKSPAGADGKHETGNRCRGGLLRGACRMTARLHKLWRDSSYNACSNRSVTAMPDEDLLAAALPQTKAVVAKPPAKASSSLK